MWPGGWLLNPLSQICLFVLEIITSVARHCSAPLPRLLCRHVFICLVIIAWSWMSRFRASAWVWANVCVHVPGDWARARCVAHICAFMNESVCQRQCVDISVYGDTACICACKSNFCQQKKGHRKLNIVHFLFKLFKQRRRLWRWQQSWIMMSYCTCIRDMKQLAGGKKVYFQNTDT